MPNPVILWPPVVGGVVLVSGALVARPKWRRGSLSALLLALGILFIAGPLAAFGTEHLVLGRGMVQMVPSWIPARVFVVYLVGVALIATGMSYASGRCLRWSALLSGLMFTLFVALMHIPGAVSHSKLRIFWIIAARDSTFAAGGLALFAWLLPDANVGTKKRMLFSIRIWIGIVVVFFGVQHLLHPEITPGVPSLKTTASWVPLPLLLSYACGIVLLVCGFGMMLGKRARASAAIAGLLMVTLTLLLYLPDALLARGVAQVLQGINYVGDTLLYGGVLLLVSAVLPDKVPGDALN